MKKIYKWIFLIIGIIVLSLIDQGTKMWAVATLKGKDAIVIIKDILELRYLENRGAAFGILQGRAIPLLVFTIVLAGLILWIYISIPEEKKFFLFQISLIFLLAGAVGNMIDRYLNQYVVDFIYFKLIDFPTFNVADCYVTVSVIVIAIIYLFVLKDEDVSRLNPLVGKKNK